MTPNPKRLALIDAFTTAKWCGDDTAMRLGQAMQDQIVSSRWSPDWALAAVLADRLEEIGETKVSETLRKVLPN